MSRVYTVSFSAVAVSAAQDLFELTPGDDHPIEIISVDVTDDTSETSEHLPFTVKRIPATPTSGSGGSAGTVIKRDASDGNASFTAEVNNTTRATSSGTIETMHREGVDMLVGFHFRPTPEMNPLFRQGTLAVIGLETNPGSSRTLSGTVTVKEL